LLTAAEASAKAGEFGEGRQSGATRSGGVHAFIANGLI
jgi:hypothetical protein